MPAMWEFSVVTSSQIPGAFAVKQMHRTRFYARQKVWPKKYFFHKRNQAAQQRLKNAE